MPAQAGIHLGARCKAKRNLDSGPGSSPGQALRRNDDPEESTYSRRIHNLSAWSRGSFSVRDAVRFASNNAVKSLARNWLESLL